MTQATFEIDAGTMDRFLDLLRSREDEHVPTEDDTLPRRAIFVAPSPTPLRISTAPPSLPGGSGRLLPTAQTW
ncbi:MAG: hypothetical protein ACFB50_15620 [Rubrobacteraceae bacterium]